MPTVAPVPGKDRRDPPASTVRTPARACTRGSRRRGPGSLGPRHVLSLPKPAIFGCCSIGSTSVRRVAISYVDLHVLHGDTRLIGLGPLPAELLAQNRKTFFTATDITENFAQMVNLAGTHWFNDKIELSGNVFYYRSVDTSSFNSDTSDFTPDGLGFLLDDGNPVLD
jgi:hypothetical protein